MNWPNDADGDVLRSLEDSGFDFSKPCLIDFNVDFQQWPPPPEAIRLLSREYPTIKVYEPQDKTRGYVLLQIYERLTYDLVIQTQAHVSDVMEPFNGECTSWGVLN